MQCFGHESMATKIRCPRKFRTCRVTILILGIRLSIGITVTCSDLVWPELSVIFLLMKPQYLCNDFQSRKISNEQQQTTTTTTITVAVAIQCKGYNLQFRLIIPTTLPVGWSSPEDSKSVLLVWSTEFSASFKSWALSSST